jgi:hypothetical protein
MSDYYEKLWSQMVAFIQEGDGKRAKEIWDSVVDDAIQWRNFPIT